MKPHKFNLNTSVCMMPYIFVLRFKMHNFSISSNLLLEILFKFKALSTFYFSSRCHFFSFFQIKIVRVACKNWNECMKVSTVIFFYITTSPCLVSYVPCLMCLSIFLIFRFFLKNRERNKVNCMTDESLWQT